MWWGHSFFRMCCWCPHPIQQPSHPTHQIHLVQKGFLHASSLRGKGVCVRVCVSVCIVYKLSWHEVQQPSPPLPSRLLISTHTNIHIRMNAHPPTQQPSSHPHHTRPHTHPPHTKTLARHARTHARTHTHTHTHTWSCEDKAMIF